MRLCCIFNALFSLSIACVNAQTVSGALELNITPSRALRLLKSADIEERAGLSVSISDTVKAWLGSSTQMTSEKLQEWLNKGKSAENVFIRMGLNRVGDKLFSSPSLSRWVQYVDDLNDKIAGTKAIATLTAQYGDNTLYKLIDAAKVIPKTTNLASKLQLEQMQRWVMTRKDPDDVFRLFDLEKAGGDLLTNPKFSVWAKYMDDLNAETPTSILPTLKKHFYEEALFRIFGNAKTMEETKTIATKLETELVQSSINRLKTPEKFFNELGLNSDAFTALQSPLLATWTKYLDGYNLKFPQEKTTMIETLTKAFGGGLTARMINVAKNQDATKAIAVKLESAQLHLWLSTGQSIDDVYKMLTLFRDADDFRGNAFLNTWVSYMDLSIKAKPDELSSMFLTLEKRFSDRSLMQILQVAKQFPNLKKTATEIQKKTIQTILKSKDSPKDVFILLGLDEAGDSILSNSLFNQWMGYVKSFNKEFPKRQESWFKLLLKHYEWSGIVKMIEKGMQHPDTLEIARNVETAWLKHLLGLEKTPKIAFISLKLKTVKNPLGSPQFTAWTGYLNAFNKRYPDKKVSMIDSLSEIYTGKTLLQVFNAAKSGRTEKLATDLQNALLNKWLAAKKKPEALKLMLHGVVDSDDMITRYTTKFNKLG